MKKWWHWKSWGWAKKNWWIIWPSSICLMTFIAISLYWGVGDFKAGRSVASEHYWSEFHQTYGFHDP